MHTGPSLKHRARRRFRRDQERAGYDRADRATIGCMLLARFAMRVAEVLFFFGMIGSAVVVIISFVEDWKELFQKD